MTDSIVVIVLCFGILLFGVAYTTMSYAENFPIQEMNKEIDASMLSSDTVYYFNLVKDVWRTTPIFFVIGLILYFYERSKGTDLPASMFFEYEVLMIVCSYISLFLVWCYGLSADSIFYSFDTSPVMGNISMTFDRTKVVLLCVKMMYLGCMIPSIVGSFLYMVHPVIRQTDNTFFDVTDDEDDGTGEYVTQYQLQQF